MQTVESRVTTAGNEKSRCAFLLIAVIFSSAALYVLYIQALIMKMEFNPASHDVINLLREKTPISYWSPQVNFDSEISGWKKNMSRNVADYLNPFNDTTIISGQEICENNNTSLIIIVPIPPSEFAKRTVIRETWASHCISEVKVGFLVGLANNQSTQTSLEQESEQFHDIIQENLVDSYSNLTLKSVALLKWFIQRCQKSNLLMKVDDDTFVDVEMLVSQLPTQNGMLAGYLCKHCSPFRDANSKWYVPLYMHERNFFPKFLFGRAYIMSMDVAIKLFAAALVSPIFHLEDVYITGFCARKAGLMPVALFNNAVFGNESDIDNCFKNTEHCLLNYTFYHPVHFSVMRTLWEVRQNRRSIENWKPIAIDTRFPNGFRMKTSRHFKWTLQEPCHNEEVRFTSIAVTNSTI